MSTEQKTYPSQFDKVKAITDQLEAGIQALFESDKFKQYLKTLSKFHDDVKEMVSLLRYCSNNLNQYAKRANETGSIYAEDIQDLQNRQNEIWEIAKEILARLATIQ